MPDDRAQPPVLVQDDAPVIDLPPDSLRHSRRPASYMVLFVTRNCGHHRCVGLHSDLGAAALAIALRLVGHARHETLKREGRDCLPSPPRGRECRPRRLELSCGSAWASGDGDRDSGSLPWSVFPAPPRNDSREKCRRDQDRDSPPGSRGAGVWWEPHACEIVISCSAFVIQPMVLSSRCHSSRTACTEPRIQPRPWLRVSVTAYPHPIHQQRHHRH